MIKTIRTWVDQMWQPVLYTGVATAALGGLLLYRLGTLVPGLSSAERAARSGSATWQLIYDNPVNAPHKIGQWFWQWAGHNGAFAMRSISVCFALVGLWLFYRLISSWQSQRVAILATGLLATSSWFLHSARYATPDIMLLSLLALVVYGNRLRYNRYRSWAVIISAIVLATALYIPGLVWFVIAGLVWQFRTIATEISRTPKKYVACSILAYIVLIAPLGWALVRDTSLLRPLLGLPAEFPPVITIATNLVEVPKQVFVAGPNDPSLWLGQLPLLDYFSIAMMVLGAYALYYQRNLDRARLIGGSLALSTVLIALGGSVHIFVILPWLYVLVAGGIARMLQQWFYVFPRNPLARGLGSALVSVAVLMAVFYHLNHYFVAWPNTPETKQAFIADITP